MAKKTIPPMKVESIRHQDKRANIPTEELRDFVAEDEDTPQTMRYPRDPSLDPQLVWKGKDEQDRADLAVPVVPIYIQEKIHPQAIIHALPRIDQSGDDQPDLFADFNGGPTDFDQKIDFYHHEERLTTLRQGIFAPHGPRARAWYSTGPKPNKRVTRGHKGSWGAKT
jgi:adenine-specific DNA-methyltransferase